MTPKPTRRSLLYVSTAVALALTLLAICNMPQKIAPSLAPASQQERGATARPDARAPGGPALAGAQKKQSVKTPLSLGLRTGDRLVYAFSQDRTITMTASLTAGMKGAKAAPEAIDTRISQQGDLVVSVYGEDEAGWTAGFQLRGARIRISSGTTATDSTPAEVAEEMGTEILALISRSGKIDNLTTPTEISAEARNQWRDILARWQVILPDDAGQVKWRRTEIDATGTYLANYQRTGMEASYRVSKEKDHYLAIASSAQSQAAIGADNAVQGQSIFQMAPYQISIEGNETFHVTMEMLNNTTVDSRATFAFHLRDGAQQSEVTAVAAQKIAAMKAGTGSFAWTGEAGKTDAGRKQPAATAQQELQGLQALLENDGDGSDEQVQAMGRLRDLIKADDATVDAVLDSLAQGAHRPEYAATLIGVLGAAGTPAAQSGLLTIATTEEWPLNEKEMALFSFAQVMEPAPEIEGWLQEIHNNDSTLGDNALLVLAGMGGRLQKSDDARYQAISDYVLAYADKKGLRNDNDQVVALAAIGNLGPTTIPRFVHESLESDNTFVRQGALESLQRTYTADADSVIAHSAVNDDTDVVRGAAAKLLADEKRFVGIDLLSRMVVEDTSEAVRKEALLSLSKNVDRRPEVEAVMKKVAGSDPSDEIRTMARDLIAAQGNVQQG